jgi:hypothetical protein
MVLGSFDVPNGMSLWIMDYGFEVFRFSGNDTGSIVPVENNRLMGLVGFDLTVNGTRAGNIRFQSRPQNAVLSRPQFEPPIYLRGMPPQSKFNLEETSTFGSVSSQGTSLLPPREGKYGPDIGPFTIVADECQRVALTCVVFGTVPIPIASISGRVAGFLIGKNLSQSLINRQRPR